MSICARACSTLIAVLPAVAGLPEAAHAGHCAPSALAAVQAPFGVAGLPLGQAGFAVVQVPVDGSVTALAVPLTVQTSPLAILSAPAVVAVPVQAHIARRRPVRVPARRIIVRNRVLVHR